MKVALLVSTYNWPEALELVLLSILRQSRMPDEVIIADDGSDERTALLINTFIDKHGMSIKHVWHEDKGFRKSIILNKALKQATSPYIIEIDGDIILHKHFVADHLRAAQPGFFVQGSRAMIGERKSNEILKTKQLDFHAFTSGMHTRFNALRLPLLSGLFKTDPTSSHNVKGCNIAFWRQDFIAINGYYNEFKGWGWEDYEFAERLINSGIMKKRLKLAAVCYHIFHPLNSRGNFEPNEIIYRETVKGKLAYREVGYHEV